MNDDDRWTLYVIRGDGTPPPKRWAIVVALGLAFLSVFLLAVMPPGESVVSIIAGWF